MLQQTQVATVMPYYQRFCERFPDVATLAEAPLADVLSLWSGLGYYARARNLLACAQRVLKNFNGHFPANALDLARLPGIGRSTAAAIAAFCFNERAAILDGNVKRVLTRHFGIEGFPGAPEVERDLWSLAESLLPPAADMPAYTQGLMDLGATLCTRRAPKCESCPLRRSCRARRQQRVDELPTARPRKTVPQRSVWMLLPLRKGEVLLQQRAPTGWWGGLQAPLQFDSRNEMKIAASTLDGSARPRPLRPRRHAFTHFTLTMHPFRLELRQPSFTVRENDQVWLPLVDLDGAALPAPIRELLRELSGHSESQADGSRRRNGACRPNEAPASRRLRASTPNSKR